ncbi:MAG: 23S rRNA (guanosine(2251)-2'-O)-methyltransferase RlmB [Treponema sp.]|nr:23S rRNA (guanosine(2251)-2'-O)-methyltransferase RlmB [Treponema sp.]
MEKVLTGFHAIEERVIHAAKSPDGTKGLRILYSAPGPRVKKIVAQAQRVGIICTLVASAELDARTKNLPSSVRDHRGIVLLISRTSGQQGNVTAFDEWILTQQDSSARATVLVLDSVTDPYNVGAIIRSADQFGASLVVMPEARSVRNVAQNEVVARASAGASAWVPLAVVPNLVRAVASLKEVGFWIYGADACGTPVPNVDFAEKTVIVLGSEGNGIAKLLAAQCDMLISIPTRGTVDSLNVSVAAGVLLYARNVR